MKIKWHDNLQKHDYPAAPTYLSLVIGSPATKIAARELGNAKMTAFTAKDIFRTSGLSSLSISNSHVKSRDRITRN